MAKILEYIMANYTWLLGGLILILLAVIGSYADKNNFGLGKTNDEEENPDGNDAVLYPQENNNIEEEKNINLENEQDQNIENIDGQQTLENNVLDNTEVSSTQSDIEYQVPVKQDNSLDIDSDEKYNKFEEEFNSILPKKDIIDEELLSDIDELSLDNPKDSSFKEIPDLDDIELPKIKQMPSSDQDIWKF